MTPVRAAKLAARTGVIGLANKLSVEPANYSLSALTSRSISSSTVPDLGSPRSDS